MSIGQGVCCQIKSENSQGLATEIGLPREFMQPYKEDLLQQKPEIVAEWNWDILSA